MSSIPVFRTVLEVRTWRRSLKASLTVGFVPTMGALHEGHLSLIRKSGGECDVTAISIFVNPMQFERSDDLTAYPRHLEEDLAKAAGAGATIAFVPSLQEMYPKGFGTHIEVSGPTRGLCGLTRPGHFRGVTTVVAKLFNLVRPLRAYFGQKDAQQTAIIRKMVHDLDMGLEIVVCPIVREPDGLAMSSRNVHLSSEERRASVCLVEALQRAKDLVEGGETDRTRLQDAMAEVIRLKAGDLARIDYIEIVDPLTMEPAPRVEGETLAALAVFLGKTRLIDNAILCH